jgi:hypothetical protein
MNRRPINSSTASNPDTPGKIHHAVIITARPASASHDTPRAPLQY